MGQEQTKEKAAAAPSTEPVATAPTPAAMPPPPVGLASTLPSSSADADDSGQPLSTGSDPEWTASIPIMADAAKRWKQGGGSLALIQMLRYIASRLHIPQCMQSDRVGAVRRAGANLSALRVLIRTTMLMFGVPAIVMILTYGVVLDQLFTFEKAGEKMVYAGIAGIVSVQFVVIGFLIYAFNEPTDEEPSAAEGKKTD